jgi:hypothetical protein
MCGLSGERDGRRPSAKRCLLGRRSLFEPQVPGSGGDDEVHERW